MLTNKYFRTCGSTQIFACIYCWCQCKFQRLQSNFIQSKMRKLKYFNEIHNNRYQQGKKICITIKLCIKLPRETCMSIRISKCYKTYEVMYWNSSKCSKSSINASNNLMHLACKLLVCQRNKFNKMITALEYRRRIYE